MTRVVIDPGVLVSALISPRAAPAALLNAWRDGRFELVVSAKLLDELRDVLGRPKFRRHVTEERAAAYVDHLDAVPLVQPDPPTPVGATPDPDDNYLLVGLATATDTTCSCQATPT